MTRILVTGRSGQMATALTQASRDAGYDVVTLGRGELDITDRKAVLDRIQDLAPSMIFNTAAFTAVDAAEAEPEAAFALNRDGAAHVAEAAAEAGARLIHFSTDYAFSGMLGRPLRESDEPDPISVYGRSKVEGESAVLDALPAAAVIRTSAIFSATGSNFLKTMVRLASEREEVRVVGDQVTAPTPADGLARIALRLAGSEGAGIFHICGQPQTSWAGFAQAIFDALSERGRRVPRLVPISTAAFGAPAPRPAFSVLADTRLAGRMDEASIDWRPALGRTIDALLS